MYEFTRSKEYNARLQRTLPGGTHYNFRAFIKEVPIHFVRGKGSRLWDMDGNEFLDMHCRFGASVLGHNSRRYNDALKEQIDTIQNVTRCDLEEEVGELLVGSFPSIEMVRYGLSGTEIVLNAIRLARAYTGKNRFIRFNNHFHGNSDMVAGGKCKDEAYPIPYHHSGDPRGSEGVASGALESQSFLLRWNDIEQLESVLSSYAHEICAIITEPICINGGGIMPKPGYLEQMRALCDRYGILLIFDEIITGFRMCAGGAQNILKVTPDLTTLGKAIAGGMPFSVLGGKREIMDLYTQKRVMHAGTFNGYALGLAAVKTSIEILSEDGGRCYERMAAYGKKIGDIMKDEAHKVGLPLVIQGPECIPVFQCQRRIAETPEEISYETMVKNDVVHGFLASHGILVTPVSRPYLNISFNEDDVDFFAQRLPEVMHMSKQMLGDLA